MKFIAEKCGYCGACVGTCPNSVLELAEIKIRIGEGCGDCGICKVVCPLGAMVEVKR